MLVQRSGSCPAANGSRNEASPVPNRGAVGAGSDGLAERWVSLRMSVMGDGGVARQG